MPIARTSGAKGKCDVLFSRLIRRSGKCRRCGYRCPSTCTPTDGRHTKSCKLQCAHIISRALSNTRCNLRNAVPLCAACHYNFTNWPIEFTRWLFDGVITEDEYSHLRSLALSGRKVSWDEVLTNLQRLWDDGC